MRKDSVAAGAGRALVWVRGTAGPGRAERGAASNPEREGPAPALWELLRNRVWGPLSQGPRPFSGSLTPHSFPGQSEEHTKEEKWDFP